MDDPPKAKKKWELTREAFDKLLVSLDDDRELAAERYEVVRQKLTTFFEHRGCLNAEEHTDDTLNRVARRLDEGATIYASKPESYFYAVARNVLKEYWARPQPTEPIRVPPHQDRGKEAREQLGKEVVGQEEERETERRFECQRQCVQGLPRNLRELVIQYYQEEPGIQVKKRRKHLGEQLGISPNALRIQVSRIRDRLDTCVLDCLGSSPDA